MAKKKDKRMTERVARTSGDLLADQVDRLKAFFPECVGEGKVDFEKLKATLGEIVDGSPERYSFTWAGKRGAIRLLQVPSRATLVPCGEDSVDFEETRNVFIEGENLEVLKLLYRGYAGRVKMIYIDPPYNTGNDFIYSDDYADPLGRYLELTEQADEAGNLLTSNPETSGRYHSAWLSMMYPRLFVARQLLTEDGVICVSIDDHEVENLKLLLNEVFGEENFVAQVTVVNNPKGRVLKEHFAVCHDFVLVYSRSALSEELGIDKSEEEIAEQYPYKENGRRYRELELRNTHRQFNRKTRKNLWYPLYVDASDGSVSLERADALEEVWPLWDDGLEGCWTWSRHKVARESPSLLGRLVGGKWKVFRKAFAENVAGVVVRKKLKTVWTERQFHTEVGQAEFDELIPGRIFEAPKPVGLVKQLVELCTDKNEDALIMDFFAGSAVTGHASLSLSREDGGCRRFVLVQLPEPTAEASNARSQGFGTISDIGKERIRRVIKKLESEKTRLGFEENDERTEDLGFRVLKLTESNYRNWSGVEEKDEDALLERMEEFTDPLLPGWKPERVIWEVAIKKGFSLTSRIEKLADVDGNTVYLVTDPDREQCFHICLDDKLEEATVRTLGLDKEDMFVCRDVALTDELAANLALQCRLRTI